MSDLKRQKANRHNAMQSTGPRSDEGKRRSSVNAMRHGLTSPLESSLWAPLLQPIEALLASEGLDKSQQRELAACILNYERNADYQRLRYESKVKELSSLHVQAGKGGAEECLSTPSWAMVAELRNADRHLRRAANQLIKECRGLANRELSVVRAESTK
ncbi:hypothetical protein FP507_03440 [Chlorobium phaeovibrioides]|uniref:Uncharacterized protein n=1 Tax=Chlorobium phaeovibrioides TaxID=1094 RepID=A0A5M8ID31_CHLPH|nr:hypothetical protein [Chlorobium phaeovibrioides]KAA6232249.1 hypothetical protein FP507_03440 [Chlorobium phaeovibrioides]